MKTIFIYDPQKEFYNLSAGMNSQNHFGKPSPTVLDMQNLGVNCDDEHQVQQYFTQLVASLKIDMDNKVADIQTAWFGIEFEAIQRLNRLFEHEPSFSQVTIYLSLNKRSSYNFKDKFFYVYALNPSTNATIIHELLHFYTYGFLMPEFKKNNIDKSFYNDYKEALTFLINSYFGDLLPNFHDVGYQKQADLRAKLIQFWKKDPNIYHLTQFVIEMHNKTNY